MIDYRKDIDGLRGFAVSLAILFHVYPAIYPGAFIGVDIFLLFLAISLVLLSKKSLKPDLFPLEIFITNELEGYCQPSYSY